MQFEPIPYPKPYTLAYYKELLLNLKQYFKLSLITDDTGYCYRKEGIQGMLTTLKVGILGKPFYYKMVQQRKTKKRKKSK